MPAAAIALLASVGFAATQIAVKRGLRTVSVEAGLVVSLGCAWAVVTLAATFSSPQGIETGSVVVFGLAGLVTPGISRWAAVNAIDRLGPSVSSSLQQGLRPLLAVVAAATILGETIGPSRACGIAAVVVGGWVLGTMRRVTTKEDVPDGNQPVVSSPWRRVARPGLIWPCIAALSYATTDVLINRELDNSPEPFLGAAIGLGAAWGAWSVAAWVVPSVRRNFRLGRDIQWFVISGCFAGGALLALYSALDKGEVSLVAPLLGTQPLMVFLLSSVFLRGIEQIERSTVLGGLLIVTGTTLVVW